MIKQNRKNLKLAILSIIWAGLLMFLNFSVAKAQNEIDISAYITDKNNLEVQNGDYAVIFSIYNSADGGQKIWEENQTVKIQDGILSAYLGSKTPLPASLNFSDANEYYLSIKIGADNEMTPRQKIGAVPMAVNASFLNGKSVGNKSGDILQLGKNGKIDPKMLPSVTTLGTVATGTWEGDVIAAQFGGTGLTSYAIGDLLYASSSTTLATLSKGADGQVLALVNGLPAWASMVEFSENVSNADDALVVADSNDDGTGDIFMKIADANKMVILNNGNVGIGTDTPAYKLDVAGTINATSLIINGEATLGTAGENITLNSSLIPSASGLNLGSSGNHWANLYVDNLSVGGTDVNGTTSEYFSINTDSLADETMGLRFYRSSLNGYAALVWNAPSSQFNLYKRENTSELADISLGIIKNGTWNGSVIASSYLASNVMTEGENISLLNNNSGYITSAGAPVQSVAGRTGSITLAQADISGLTTASSPSFAGLISNGNVGIGTTTPGWLLDVNGSASIQNNLLAQLEGGTFYGRTKVTENQWTVGDDRGVTWTARDSSRGWANIAMSSDGKYQTAVAYTGQIYTSTDYGVTWTARDSNRAWWSIAMSSDGKYQTAGNNSGQIYTSTDYGVTWTARDSSRAWTDIAMSADGKYQTAVAVSGQIYTSTDYGVTWTARDSSRIWRGIAMSSDGKYQTAVATSGQIYTSTDYGVTWTARDSNRGWRDIAMSSDGKYQTAVAASGQIYTSTDYGVTWTVRDSSRGWYSVAMSSDGKYQTATVSGGQIYTSTDYGIIWTARDSSRAWYGIAMSSDGKYQTAVDFGGQIYTSHASSYMAEGNVGINIALPTATLHLVGAAGTVGLELNSNETTAGNNILMLRSDVAGADDAVFRVQADGAVFADGAYTGTGADYAEYFYTKNKDLQAGEVVCIDSTSDNAVKRCERSGDNDIMGIVSSKPSIVGNSADNREKDPNYKIIGMLGQISGKVSNENGEILIGDSLTSASVSGYMRKANAGESTVGVALQSLNDDKGTIQILISRRNKSLTVEKVEEEVARRIAEMDVEDQVNALVSGAKEELLKDSNDKFASYDLQISALNELANTLQAQITELQTKTNMELNLAQIDLNTQDIALIKQALGLNTAEPGDLSIIGKIIAKKIVVEEVDADGIVAGAFTVKENSTDSPTIGKGIIKKGEKETIIESKSVADGSRVFVTVEMNKNNTEIPNQLLVVAEIISGESFKVMSKEPVSEDTEFSWWIVNMETQ